MYFKFELNKIFLILEFRIDKYDIVIILRKRYVNE